MNVRDLERLLVERGATAAKMDAVTRQLRQAGRLPKGGRGQNAPDITAADAAAIVIGLAGSVKGLEAEIRLQKLENLTAKVVGLGKLTLLDTLTLLFKDPSAFASVYEIRISRTSRRAVIIYSDGTRSVFSSGSPSTPRKFYVEGVLPKDLILAVARALRSKTRP